MGDAGRHFFSLPVGLLIHTLPRSVAQFFETAVPGALIAKGLGIVANLGTARLIDIRTEFNIAIPPSEFIGFVFVIWIFNIKFFTTTQRAFHSIFSKFFIINVYSTLDRFQRI